MNHVDSILDMVSLLCDSVAERAQKRDNGCCLASVALSGRKLSPSIYPDARHLSFSLYATGTLLAAVWVLENRGSESA